MTIVVDCQGDGCCLYGEAIDLATLGELAIRRASHVEPDSSGKWWADMLPVNGPKLGPFEKRSEALDAEQGWLIENRLE